MSILENTVVAAFRKQVLATPDATAVCDSQINISYRELDQRSTQLACWIQQLVPESEHDEAQIVIPFCLNSGIEQIEVIIAIIKTGAAYVPIDPNLPDSKIEFILNDIRASIIITDSNHASRLKHITDAVDSLDLYCLEQSSFWTVPGISNSLTPSSIAQDSACYIIYTSGTTGNPKGVIVPHCGVTRLVLETNYIDIKPHDCFSKLSNIAFDATTFEIWGALLNGARVAIIDMHDRLNTQSLSKIIHDLDISVMFMTTGLFNQHVISDQNCFAGLRYLLFGGEVASTEIVRRLYQSKGCPEHLINVYGPTENTTFSTFHEICHMPESGQPLPIGRAISGSQCYLVDNKMQVVEGVGQGELLLSGAGLATGYLHNSKLTDQKFIHLPFCTDRLYRTGDTVGRLESGDYIFIGRIDNQVKIRGFRIELENIEGVLNGHPAIDGAVVHVKKEGVANTKRLIAYLNCANAPTVQELRDYLLLSLPDYMLPSRFFLVESFPFLSTGKVDRLALMNVSSTPLTIERGEQQNSSNLSELEKEIHTLWAKHLMLSVDEISVDDDFFALGGESLIAMGLIAELGRIKEMILPITAIFEYPSIRLLAQFIECETNTPSFNSKTIPTSGYLDGIPHWNGIDPLPLSPFQEQIWQHQQQGPEYPFYNEPLSITMPQYIDVNRLHLSLGVLINRHEALRTNFCLSKTGIVHKFRPKREKPDAFIYHDLRSFPPSVAEKQALRLAKENAVKLFDIVNDELIRFCLVRIEEELFCLHIVAHHLIIDGVAIYQVFLPELSRVYSLMEADLQISLPEQTFSYCDWLSWLHHKRNDRSEGKEFFRQQLTGMSPVHLPADKPKTRFDDFSGARECLSLSLELTCKLHQLAAMKGSSLFMVLLTAFKILLYRYTQQTDLTIATAVSNRNIPGSEKLIGNFVNTLLLRTILPAEATFVELLEIIRENCVQAYRNQDISLLEVMRQVSNIPMDNSINVAFVFEPAVSTMCGEWGLSQLDVHTDTSKFDLTIELDERDKNIIGRIEYSTQLFESATIQRLIKQFNLLLEGIVQEPDCQYSKFNILDDSDHSQLLSQWNNTRVDYEGSQLLHKIIEEQMDKTPDAVAVICNDNSISYGELDQKSNQLAHYLIELGVGADDIVVVWTDRSIEHIICLLAVLKAGGAYVPVDFDDPLARIEFILDDTRASIVICDAIRAGLIKKSGVQIVTSNFSLSSIKNQLATRPQARVDPHNLAYIIYTSGSSGQPKGVLVEHQQIAGRTHWAAATFNLSSDDVMLHLFALPFDASILPTWWSLNQGAAVLMPNAEALLDPYQLYALITRHQVTAIVATPAVMTLLVDILQKNGYGYLRFLATGGELMSHELCRKMNALAPCVKNYYGPTETVVIATEFLTGEEIPHRPPIGKPIANTEVYVLDQNHCLVPVGVPGELYIGGKAVARGYLNRPELNERHFIINPFSDNNSRLYRTGDIVRFLPNGDLDYRGRVDKQVKIRGFRVEPSEIESVIRKQTLVQDCVVVVHKNNRGIKQLIAYFTSEREGGHQELLQQQLAKQLPLHMMPAACIELSHLPLTARGKVDVLALPNPEVIDDISKIHIAPQTKIETQLAKIWTSVLGESSISINDDFYAVGGDSLASLEFIVKANELGIEISVADMYRLRTIENIAKKFRVDKTAATLSKRESSGYLAIVNSDHNEISDDHSQAINLKPELLWLLKSGFGKAIFFIHPFGAGASCYRHLSDRISGDYCIYGIESVDADKHSIEETAKKIIECIRNKQPTGPYILGGWSMGGILAHEICHQLETTGSIVELLILFDSTPSTEAAESDFLELIRDNETVILAMATIQLERITGKSIPVNYNIIVQQQCSNLRAWYFKELRRQTFLSAEIINDIVIPFVDNTSALVSQIAEHTPHCVQAPVILFVGRNLSQEEKLIQQLHPDFKQTNLGDAWRPLTHASVSVHFVAGCHQTMIHPPYVDNIAKLLNMVLSSK